MSAEMTVAEPRVWDGRYARIPGYCTAFHVKSDGGDFVAFADWEDEDETARCPFVDSDATQLLAEAVADGKEFLTGTRSGGSFLINEFGDVLVPNPEGGGSVAVVGRFSGPLLIHDNFNGSVLDISSTDGLSPGDELGRPYIGIPHNLSKSSELYFWSQDDSGEEKMSPPTQDDELISSLREIRSTGAIRFIVMYGGLIATKVPRGSWKEPTWHAHFVGKLDFDHWFPEGA